MRRIDALHLAHPYAGARMRRDMLKNAYERVSHARESLARFIAFYNTGRPHSSLDRQTPDEVYFDHSLDERKAA